LIAKACFTGFALFWLKCGHVQFGLNRLQLPMLNAKIAIIKQKPNFLMIFDISTKLLPFLYYNENWMEKFQY